MMHTRRQELLATAGPKLALFLSLWVGSKRLCQREVGFVKNTHLYELLVLQMGHSSQISSWMWL